MREREIEREQRYFCIAGGYRRQLFHTSSSRVNSSQLGLFKAFTVSQWRKDHWFHIGCNCSARRLVSRAPFISQTRRGLSYRSTFGSWRDTGTRSAGMLPRDTFFRVSFQLAFFLPFLSFTLCLCKCLLFWHRECEYGWQIVSTSTYHREEQNKIEENKKYF